MAGESAKRRSLDGHRLSEFIYGTVTGMVAIVGIDSTGDVTWLDAVFIIVAGATAIWLAHAYATHMSRRVTGGQRTEGRDIIEALTSSWPVVSAGLFLAVPLIGAAVGVYGIGTALLASSALGVLVLAMIGVAAGAVTHETWPRRIVLILLSCGLGIAVMAVELALHH